MNDSLPSGLRSRLWRQDLRGDDSWITGYPVARLLLPWLPFFLLLTWSWQAVSLFKEVPHGRDNYELLWALSWFARAIANSPRELLHYDLVFHPEGWFLVNSGFTQATFLYLIPMQWLAGPAFALNSGYLLMMCATYAGVYRLARLLKVSMFTAVLAALLYTFWGNRWFRIYGHSNVLLALALLPWLIWSMERAILTPHRRRWWILLAGLLWAVSIYSSLYFIWLGGFAIIGWMGVRILNGDIEKRQGATAAFAIVGLGLLLALPYFLLYWQGLQVSQHPSRTISELNSWGASLNSMAVPSVNHPFLSNLARSIYAGPYDESGVANFGPLAVLLALVSIPFVWTRRRWRPLLALALGGTILALGTTLRWDGESLQLPLFKTINEPIWQIGHALKPAVFDNSHSPEPFLEAIPLPGMIAAAVVPFWDSARVSARFALVAGIGVFTAAAIGVSFFKARWVRALLAVLLIIEIFPFQLQSKAYPPQPHTAFDWLEANSAPEDGIVNVHPLSPDSLTVLGNGETLLATNYHRRATASGASSVWPAHTVFLRDWLASMHEPLRTDEFSRVMRFFGVRFVAVHMDSRYGQTILEQLEDNPQLELVGCFAAAEEPTIWPNSICLVEVLPPLFPQTNLILQDGWSGQEEWGVWAEGVSSRADWIATAQADHQLSLEAFPFCIDGKHQEITITNNQQELVRYGWQGCDPWSTVITIPADSVEIGQNRITLDYGYAANPAEDNDGQNIDPRPLSVGFSRLWIER